MRDDRIIETNLAFAQLAGCGDLRGKRFSEIGSAFGCVDLAMLGRVARSGRAERVDAIGNGDGRTFSMDAFRTGAAGDGRVSMLIRDVTERRRLESALSASEAQQAFLLRFAEALRPLTDTFEIEDEAAHRLCEHLGADYAVYSEFDPVSALPVIRRESFRYGAGGVGIAEPIAQSQSILAHLRAGTP